MSDEISKKLDFCWNHYSHEGEFKVLGKTINVFRMCEYENDEGEMVYPGADCGAFIDSDYFTGWFEEDLGEDLKYVMKDVLEHLFKVTDIIAFTIKGGLDLLDCDDVPKSKIKAGIKNDLLKILENIGFEGAVLKLAWDYDNETYAASFRAPATLLAKGYNYLDDVREAYYDCEYVRDGKMEPIEPSIKEFMDTAFETKISFY